MPLEHGLEGASQSYKIGELVIETAGLIVVSTADPASIVVGVALRDATGTTGADAPYIPLMEGVLFEASLMGAAAADYIMLAADRGTAYGVAVSANKWYIDSSETSATLFRVLFPAKDFVVGDTNARVVVQPVTAKYRP
jgi:hypothetical protein